MAGQARERLIGATIDLIRRDGVAGTGINNVSKNSGAARRSIYLNFPEGKDQLIAESVATSGQFIGKTIQELGRAGSPEHVLTSIVDIWKTTLIDSDFQSGCPVAAGALAGSAAPSAPSAAAKTFALWENLLTEQFTAADVESDAARSLAGIAIAAIEGAVVVSIARRTVEPFDGVLRHLLELVELHARK